tara:strand:- start:138 stop:482 length:345 start_codon:yes stop_codon:yes gene_type:complete
MVFVNKNEIQRKRNESYAKQDISPKSLSLLTQLNSKSDILENAELITLLEEKFGSTASYQEQESEYVLNLLSNCLTTLSYGLDKYTELNPNLISQSITKTSFNHEFAKEFGFFV